MTDKSQEIAAFLKGENEPEVNIPVYPNASLKDYTTFQLGGHCSKLYDCKTPQDLIATVNQLNEEQTPFILIGGGSNLLVSDDGIDCAVIRYYTEEPQIHGQKHRISVSGSTKLDDLVKFAVYHGLEGINYASGIPGTVGGAVVGNAGAFGKQIGDILIDATLLTKEGLLKTVHKDQLGFAYRTSNLKKSTDIVLSVTLFFQDGNKELLQQQRMEILKTREEKHPNLWTHPCAGSFFRNIEPTSAAGKRQSTGYYLERAGGKSLFHGGAKIFDKHANIIVKLAGCTSQDVYELHRKMKALAKEKWDYDLVREVRFVGNFENNPEHTEVIW